MFKIAKKDEKLLVELLENIHAMDTVELTKTDIIGEAKTLPRTLKQDMLSHRHISPDFKMAIGAVR